MRDLLAPFIFAIGCFLFFVLAIPQYDQILDIRAAYADREVLLTDRTALRQNVVSLVQQYESRKGELDRLTMILPAKDQLDSIIESIQTTASQNGIQLKTVAVGFEKATTSTGSNRTANIVMETNGTYDAMLNYVKELEKSIRIFDITEISISKNLQATSSNQFNISIKANVYSMKK
jgi:Tfp pilus assembly protein PilO